jgi:uncharacterized protein (DUF362 family)/Pyruvate/2-oxoacid:ferredoxin oxidoreductase delta subunit
LSTTVAIAECSDYDRYATFEAVKRAVNLLGGMSSCIKPGERVLIKPNLLKASRPEDAVTTHPEVVRAVIRIVRDAGGIPLIGDSPGIGELDRVCERAGIRAVIEEEGAVLTAFDDPVAVRNRGRFQRYEIGRAVMEADAIINLPKLKTHGMMVLTGAVKNLFGCIPGKRKVQWHFNSGVDHASFARMLVELSALLKPRLSIMDAIVGMEGNGPGSGDPRKIGVVLAGRDPVSVDVVAADLVGCPPEHLPVIRVARETRIGETRLDRVQLVGDSLDAVRVRGFRFPPREHTEWRLPEWMKRTLKNALTTRPVIDHHSCVRCGICRNDCPQQAISDENDRFVIDHRNCIRCFCCQEFCPQGAITVAKGWFLRFARQ